MVEEEQIEVRLFAAAREAGGFEGRRFPVSRGETVQAVLDRLGREFPDLARVLPHCRVAVNEDFASLEQALRPGDRLAILPPVGGGAEQVRVELSRTEIDPAAVQRECTTPECGAVSLFLGAVRNENLGRRVRCVEYEAYPEMAIRRLNRLGEEALERFGVHRVVLVHRLGRLELGQLAIAIGVGSAHRAEAFEATRHLLDRVKQEVPIWKKEFFEGGEAWLGLDRSMK